ncbi:hypothetical protein ACFVUH_10045 [Kitasatospora sp. NPDC058032]|uniref:hypothetical protein n=1 Tax=Kitasatospora sp. NPDC058032 TaxID=3346307 RepID=UPI0036DB9B4D
MDTVRIFPARAMGPQVQANARWIAVDAASRQAYVLSGKDGECPLLTWIAKGRARDTEQDFVSAARGIGLREWPPAPAAGILGFYRRLNLNYPFLDYSVEESHQVDRSLMDGYAGHAAPPPVATPREGPRLGLDDAPLVVTPCGAAPPQAALLSAWLSAAARITGRRQGRHGPIVLKTSPSGGARHPTDLGVIVGDGWPGELRGAWWYDGDQHALARADQDLRLEVDVPAGGIAVVLTSHVERAMWRYRDVRAWRPVLIDAGHVLETLDLAVRATGWHTAWLPLPAFAGGDPVLGVLAATPRPAEVQARALPGLRTATADDEYRTSPFLSLVPAADGLYADVHGEPGTPLPLTPAAVTALAYANPSTRGDRPSTLPEISRNSGAAMDELRTLAAAGALLPAEQARAAWSTATPWTNAGWLPSLLVHADAVREADAMPSKAATEPPGVGPVPWTGLPAALAARRTHRSFSGLPVPEDVVETLLHLLDEARSEVRLSLLHPHGLLGAGTYKREHTGGWEHIAPAPSPAQIQSAAIGQPWTAGISVVAWLVPRQDGSGAGAWQESLLQCGRDAQRIALGLATDRRVGVFQSPALVDDRLGPLTGLDQPLDGAYLVGIGSAKATQSTTPQGGAAV